MSAGHGRYEDEVERLRTELEEATSTLEAIRTGQVDALVVENEGGHSLYTLQSADHAYRVFVEQMTEGAVTLNTAGLILYCNTRFADMVRLPLSRVLGNAFSHFVSSQDQHIFDELFRHAWGGPVKQEILLGDQDPVPVQLSVNVLRPFGEVTLSMIVTDLTAVKKTERELHSKNEQLVALNEALLNSNHDLQQFASVASHDLQEPLRKIQVYSTLLAQQSEASLLPDSKHALDRIINAAHRMKTLIIDILTYSRLSADDPGMAPVDMQLLVSEILEDLDLRIIEREARVELGRLPVIEGNSGQLRQVLYNIINNALKFIPAGRKPEIVIREKKILATELGVSLDKEQNYCRISISDNGIGFDERFAHTIFSLFEKLNPKSEYEGSGIGLSIAKKIIDKHQGLIIPKSVIGQGSEFNIILPYKHTRRGD